jgi:electron transfer flavoprotein beta subunit
MRLVVCVKAVPDPGIPLGTGPGHPAWDPSSWGWELNPSDGSALALALQLRGPAGTVTALSLGMQAPRALRRAVAGGADQAILLADQVWEDPDILMTARILAAAASRVGCDAVLCGYTTLDGQGGSLPAVLAGFLDCPLVSPVVEAWVEASGLVVRTRLARGRRARLTPRLPAVLAVDGTPHRMEVSLPAHIRALTAPLEVWDDSTLGLGSCATHVTYLGLEPPRPRPKKIFTPDSRLSAAERLRQLMTGGRKEKQGELFTGSPGQAAEHILGALRREGIIPEGDQLKTDN